jgi:ADP-ribose pyrophosphatase YjhB (NUDIX family)/predicted transcriptional regulator
VKSIESSSNLHPAQLAAIGVLLHGSSAKFSEMATAAALSSDHMNFHIRRLVELGLVEHTPKSYGEYRLTKTGKDIASKLDSTSNAISTQPKISVILHVVDAEGLLLRQERLRHPYYGYWARPSGKILRGEQLLDAAARILRDEAGLTADLSLVNIEHRIERDKSGNLIEDKYLYIVEGKNHIGELVAETPGRRNYWISEQDYDKKEKRFAHPLSKSASIIAAPVDFSEQTYIFRDDEY